LNLRIPKEQQLAGQNLARFERLREQQEAMLHNSDAKVVNGTSNGL
jgi:hypothetical protein